MITAFGPDTPETGTCRSCGKPFERKPFDGRMCKACHDFFDAIEKPLPAPLPETDRHRFGYNPE